MNRYFPAWLGLVGGLAGGFLAGTLAAPGTAPATPAPGVLSPEPASADEAMEDRLLALEAETSSLRIALDTLRADVALLPDGGGRKPLATADPQPEGGDATPDEGLALTGDPYFDQRVLAVLQARDEARRAEREARDAERRQQMLDARVERLKEQLGLDDVQAQVLRDVLAESDAKRRELFASMRDAGGSLDRATIAEQMRSIESEARESLSSVLTPSQMEQINSTRGGLGGFGGRGGSFFGGRGGGDGRGR